MNNQRSLDLAKKNELLRDSCEVFLEIDGMKRQPGKCNQDQVHRLSLLQERLEKIALGTIKKVMENSTVELAIDPQLLHM